MLKKLLIVTLLCMSVVCGASAADSSMSESDVRKVLTALSISPEDSSGKITKNSFINAIAGLLFEDPQAMGSAEDLAEMIGISELGDIYNGEAAITGNEAVEYALTVLGYKPQAELEGYLKTASQLKLLEGITVSDNNIMPADARRLIYNMLDAEPMAGYYKNQYDNGYTVMENETLLSLNRHIYEIEGMVTDNSITSIYREQGAGEGRIKIDGIEYYSGSIDIDRYLGKNVRAYVKQEKNSDGEILFITEKPGKNKVLQISGDDIVSVDNDFTVIEYENDSESVKKAKLSNSIKVIYNGVFYGEYQKADLMPEEGGLELIDNDSDGKYDVIFVTSYETVVVQNVDISEEKIYNRYAFGLDILEFAPDSGEVNCEILFEDSPVGIEAFKKNDIISVAKSKNSENIAIRGFLGRMVISGIVQEVDTDKKSITINGSTYKLTKAVEKYSEMTGYKISAGNEYTFYIDYFGNIAYFKSVEDYDYRLLLRVYEEEERYYAVLMDLEEEWESVPFAKSVTLNNDKLKDYIAYNELSGEKPQMVIIAQNSAGELKKVETAQETSKYMQNKFTKTEMTSYTYRSPASNFANTIFLESDAKVVFFPANDSMNKEDYYVRSAFNVFWGDGTFTISAYNIDFYGFTHLLAMKQAPTKNYSTNLFVITSVSQSVNSDNEILSVIQGNFGSYINISMSAKDKDVFKDLKSGDIVRISTDRKGYVDGVNKLFSMRDEFVKVSVSDFYADKGFIAGVVEDCDAELSRIKLDCGVSVTFRLDNVRSFQSYDGKKIEYKDIAELRKGDKVACRIGWGKLEELIRIEED